MDLTAIIPAVDEPDVDATIRSLLTQKLPPDRVIVAWNNHTNDSTKLAVERVSDPRIELHDLGQITGRKAGALNAVLPLVNTEYVLVMDADTTMGEEFLSTAEEFLAGQHVYAAVGGVFHGVKPSGMLQWFQYLEYERFAHEVERTHRVMVMTGTGSVIRMDALRVVRDSRYLGVLPGEGYYDESAVTEDNEMSLALKSCGYKLASPKECSTTTELMGTWHDLQKQRIRWYRGALDNLRTYGFTKVTRRYWMQQALLMLSVMTFGSYLMLSVANVAFGWFGVSLVWSAVGLIFMVERIATVWNTGWRGRLLAGLIVPELVYSAALQIAFVRGIAAHLRGRTPDWHQAAGVRATTEITERG